MASSKLEQFHKMVEERGKVSISERTTPVDSFLNKENTEEKKPEMETEAAEADSKPAPGKKETASNKKQTASKAPAKESSAKEKPKKSNEAKKQSEEPKAEKDNTEKKKATGDKKKSENGLINRKLGNAVELEDVKVASWNCRITEELYLRFRLLMALNNTTKTELINRIMYQERKWVEAHPEFPDMQFQIEALKKSRISEDGKQSIYSSFALTSDNHAFIKEMSSKCLMKMYAYVSWVIEQYCDIAGIPKEI